VAVGSAWSAHARLSRLKLCFPCFETLFLSPFFSLRLKNVVLLSAGYETTLDESVKNCLPRRLSGRRPSAWPCPRPSWLSVRPLASMASPWVAPPRVICGPWAAMCATDSAGRCTTALGGPSPQSRGLTRPSRAQVRCWLPPLRWRSFRPCRRLRPGQILPRVEMTPSVLLLPLPMSEPTGTICLKYVYIFCGR
jgi:hypothetical protein